MADPSPSVSHHLGPERFGGVSRWGLGPLVLAGLQVACALAGISLEDLCVAFVAVMGSCGGRCGQLVSLL